MNVEEIWKRTLKGLDDLDIQKTVLKGRESVVIKGVKAEDAEEILKNREVEREYIKLALSSVIPCDIEYITDEQANQFALINVMDGKIIMQYKKPIGMMIGSFKMTKKDKP